MGDGPLPPDGRGRCRTVGRGIARPARFLKAPGRPSSVPVWFGVMSMEMAGARSQGGGLLYDY